jgi:predicted PhzF superfamily epimerase YddE/YHI9
VFRCQHRCQQVDWVQFRGSWWNVIQQRHGTALHHRTCSLSLSLSIAVCPLCNGVVVWSSLLLIQYYYQRCGAMQVCKRMRDGMLLVGWCGCLAELSYHFGLFAPGKQSRAWRRNNQGNSGRGVTPISPRVWRCHTHIWYIPAGGGRPRRDTTRLGDCQWSIANSTQHFGAAQHHSYTQRSLHSAQITRTPHTMASVKLPYTILNAFTTTRESGNPAAVVPLPAPAAPPTELSTDDLLGLFPSDDRLLSVAKHFGLPMTAFPVPLPSSKSEPGLTTSIGPTPSYALRWFHPDGEAPLCGHATLALSSYLFESLGGVKHLRYLTRYHGEVSALLVSDPFDSGREVVALDFPELRGFQTVPKGSERYAEIMSSIKRASEGWKEDEVVNVEESETYVLVELESGAGLKAIKIDPARLVSRPAGSPSCDARTPRKPGHSERVRCGSRETAASSRASTRSSAYRTSIVLTSQDAISPKQFLLTQLADPARSPAHIHSRVFGTAPGHSYEDTAVSTSGGKGSSTS